MTIAYTSSDLSQVLSFCMFYCCLADPYISEGQQKIYGGNAIWNKYVLNFFRKIAIVSDVFEAMGNSFQTLGAATEKVRLPKLSFV